MKIQDAIWFTELGGQCIGIVIGQDENTGERKAYIGTGYGEDEYLDAHSICEHGAKFHPQSAEFVLNYLQGTQKGEGKVDNNLDKVVNQSPDPLSNALDRRGTNK